MNKLVVAGAVATGLFAGPALAADAIQPFAYPAPVQAAGIQGYMGAGWAMLNGLGGETANVYAVGGALNVPVGGLNVEFEGAGAELAVAGAPTFAYSRGYVHAFYRTPGFAIGGFGGFEAPSITSIGVWTLGGEAQAYTGNLNLYGQVGWQNFTPVGFTGWTARGSAQFFLTSNILAEADVRYNSAFVLTGTSAWTFGGQVEARFAGTPWSIFATARHTTISGAGSANAGLVGIRAHVGDGTLLQQYTTGASMNVIPLL
jgi:hypothetical protein